MSVYPFAYDSDETILRIDDNITELGGEVSNQLRDAVFAMQGELGLGLKGSLNTLADRLNVSLNANGTIKQSALAAVGLVTLPIVDNQVATNAGIKEFKLSLDYSTSNLHTIITANKGLLDAVNAFASTTNTNFLNHLAGSSLLSDGTTSAKHVASHIDLNSIPTDPRDPFFSWTGLKNSNGVLRTAAQVAEALLQINDDLVAHENSLADAHIADAISVDASEFQEIPNTANTVQKVFDYIDHAEELNIGEHRAVQHSNGIPGIARSQSLTESDGYGRDTVVPSTTVNAYLVNPPANTPVDSNTVGDDVILFKPTNTSFVFDSQFSQVRIGDILRINYGNGTAASFEVESIRFNPGAEWIVRINGSNLANAVDGYVDGYSAIATARIDRPQYDYNTKGVLALASANAIPSSLYPNILGSLIVGNPRAATALGLGFDGNKLNSSHYKLWLQLYPTGNPSENVVTLPFIDVTGNAGASPGSYTLEKVVHATNDAFRKIGYNYRFIAFEYKGDFGIMLADPINKASFAIIDGSNSSGTLLTGSYTQNVIGDATDGDGFDAFGLGSLAAQIASPAYQGTWADATAAQLPTKVITPVKRRFYIVDGHKLDTFAPTYMANSDGYWPATITSKVSTGSSVEITYKINLDLRAAKLKSGKTLVVQPDIPFDSSNYFINDYGRFIIKQVNFSEPCGAVGAFSTITVINGVHAIGTPVAFTSDPGLAVKIYFSEDSVGFNDLNIIDNSTTGINYHRYHEVYVTKNGTTFSHERARMKADQAEASPPTSLLRSDFWHIKSVSAKLRGYQDSISTFNKYVRFYVTRYVPSSGEFDGYIGRRNPSSAAITRQGPLTTSRKGVQTRFYDETYVDYIDLEFKEIALGPSGTAIISDANPRYVDIEIFPTLRLDVENMLIGSCEVNWHPSTGQNIIQCVKDLRDFGSVGPNEFNNAAVDFISAGDKLLHENGIIRGFQFVASGATSTNGQLFFDGGVALVNGKIVTTNNSSVTIPAISDAGATGVTVTWAVCVNEFGYLQPIILTTNKDQIFAGVGSLYYVQSVTFDELINSRKDLTLIATVDAHIASITINDSDVHDLRRFIGNQGASHPLVLTQDQFVGNFYTFDAVKQWVNRTGGNSQVRIRGAWTFSSSVDLTGFTKSVVFDGDGAIFTITSLKGFLLGSNVILKNCSFIYSPSFVAPETGDIVMTGNGCLYASSAAGDISNLIVENCKFSSLLGYPRSPYINIEIDKGQKIFNSKFIENSFSDSATSKLNAAIAIISLNASVSSTLPAAVVGVVISHNYCDRDQGIIISVPVDDIARPGINIVDTIISENKCGYVGYWSTSVANTGLSQFNPSNGLVIKNNTCHYIQTAMGNGKSFFLVASYYTWGFGSVLIEGNFCNWIHVCSQDGAASGVNTEFSSMIIQSNTLTAYDFTNWLNTNFIGDVSTNIGIIVQGFPKSAANDITTVQVLNNNLNIGKYGASTYKYVSGMYIEVGGNVQGNIVKGFVKDVSGLISSDLNGIGIIVMGSTGDATRNYMVSNNQIYRGSDTINAYISSGNLPSYGIVQDNFLDSSTIDGATATTVIVGLPTNWLCQRNKNQTVAQMLHVRNGSWAIAATLVGPAPSGTSTVTNLVGDAALAVFNYNNAPDPEIVTWKIPLIGIVPHGVTIVRLEATAKVSVGSGTIQFTVKTPTGTDSSSPINLTLSDGSYQLSISNTDIVSPTIVDPIPEVIISLGAQHGSTSQVTISNVIIRYMW